MLFEDPDSFAEWARAERRNRSTSQRDLAAVLEQAFERWPASAAIAGQLMVLYRNDVDRCTNIWRRLLNEQGHPTVYMCNNTVKAYAKAGKPEKARAVSTGCLSTTT